jgi:SAM-dependent methyltransferase
MDGDNWFIWSRDKKYQDLLQKRAAGEEEMQSAVATCEILKPLYQPGMAILDVGCGTGHYLNSLRARLDPFACYTGVDATASYIGIAQETFPGVKFAVGDICQLPFADNAFDIVLCMNVIGYIPPPPSKALAELVRVTKQYLVVRAALGVRNYIIKEVASVRDGNGASSLAEKDAVKTDGELELFNYRNLYTESYFAEALAMLDASLKVEFIKDDLFNTFDNREQTTPTGTHVISNQQISGNILLDHYFMFVHKIMR